MSARHAFTGSCHKVELGEARQAMPVQCNIRTDDPVLFTEHMATVHGFRSYVDHMPVIYGRPHTQPPWVRTAGKRWKLRYTRKLFEPKPFDVGDVVTFDSWNGTITGQVWSNHPAPKTRWVVADQIAYEVHERDLMMRHNEQEVLT